MAPTAAAIAADLFEGPVQDLVDELSKLPSIGGKTAQRIAFHLLRVSKAEAGDLARAIVAVKENVSVCGECFNFAAGERCRFCSDPRRDSHLICVVESPPDIIAVEKTGEFRGLYHVLGGAISPIEGIGPDQLRVKELLARLGAENTEAIIATNPNVEGEATAMYLARLLEPLGVKVTRIASGLPVGGDLEYADEVTLGRALEGRHEIHG